MLSPSVVCKFYILAVTVYSENSGRLTIKNGVLGVRFPTEVALFQQAKSHKIVKELV